MPLLTPLAKILVCLDQDEFERHLFITDKWSLASAVRHAETLNFEVLYVVNIWRKT